MGVRTPGLTRFLQRTPALSSGALEAPSAFLKQEWGRGASREQMGGQVCQAGPQTATFKLQIHLLSLLKFLPCRDRFGKWLPSSLKKYTTQMGLRRGTLLSCPPPSQLCVP